MRMPIKFRTFLLPIFICICAAPAAISIAADATAPPFTLHEVASGVWAAIDNRAAKGDGSGANAGFVIGADGVLVVDTFQHPAAAQELLNDIRQKTKLPIRFVVNTHYHIDHVAGNNIFAGAGATILAQQNVRVWERTENLKFFGPKITPAQKQMVESLGLPNITYKDGVELHLGSRRAIVVSLPGHTGGDSVIFIPGANVVFTGDLFWDHTLPNLIDASTQPWIASLDTILQHHPDATFVPGHGEVGKAGDVRDFRNYLQDLRADIAHAQAAGKSDDSLTTVVLPELRQKYGSWNFFAYFAKPDIHYTDLELRGKKSIPQPPAQ
ncbi:MAG TPA: MBL fold metallo-hydrolase [Candidatus Acidoferrales bacterium]|nr:MBL fold metallo-hydrolase [Candidatus Acidoferrales bacterium]